MACNSCQSRIYERVATVTFIFLSVHVDNSNGGVFHMLLTYKSGEKGVINTKYRKISRSRALVSQNTFLLQRIQLRHIYNF